MKIENPIVDGFLVRPFIRARVEINILNPLSTGCWIPRKNLSRFWVFVKYERMQDLCYNCGIIGHEQRICKKEKVMSMLSRDAERYGPSIGVPLAKTIVTFMAEQNRWKSKSQEDVYEV